MILNTEVPIQFGFTKTKTSYLSSLNAFNKMAEHIQTSSKKYPCEPFSKDVFFLFAAKEKIGAISLTPLNQETVCQKK